VPRSPKWPVLSGFLTRILFAFLICPMCTAFIVQVILLNLIILVVFDSNFGVGILSLLDDLSVYISP